MGTSPNTCIRMKVRILVLTYKHIRRGRMQQLAMLLAPFSMEMSGPERSQQC